MPTCRLSVMTVIVLGLLRSEPAQPAEIKGRVIDNDGKPVASMRLSAQDVHGSYVGLVQEVKSADDGSFQIDVSPGTFA